MSLRFVETTNANLLPLRFRGYTVSTGLANTPTSLARAPVAVAIDNNDGAPNADYTDDNPVVTLANHYLYEGDFVILAGATDAQFVGAFKVSRVIDANTFTIKVPGSTGLDSPADVTLTTPTWAQRAFLVADPANTAAVALGPNKSVAHKKLNAGDEYDVDTPVGSKFSLADWYVKSTGVNQVVNVAYE